MNLILIEFLFLFPLFASIRNRICSLCIRCLPIISSLLMFIQSCIQSFRGIFIKDPSSLVNIFDNDFDIQIENSDLFKLDPDRGNDKNPDIHDLFHIYLSKLLYESDDQIKKQCEKWRFSIKIFNYIQKDNWNTFTYSTKAVVLKHNQSNTIIIGFRGTEPMDLIQWLTDSRRDFIHINNHINNHNKDEDIRIHAGFYYALGLNQVTSWNRIDLEDVSDKSPIVIQLLDYLNQLKKNDNDKFQISVTGHSLGGALASLFSYVLLLNDYKSSISGVYTYGQPSVGNYDYAYKLNEGLGTLFHRWVNHSDIVARIPHVALSSIASETIENYNRDKSIHSNNLYFQSGLRFKINREGNHVKYENLDQRPILGYEDGFYWWNINYALYNITCSLFNLKPLRALFWLVAPVIINDHLPCDYANKIENILKMKKKAIVIK